MPYPTLDQYAPKFWKRVRIGDPDQCWPWTGKTDRRGRGVIRWQGRGMHAPAMAFLLTHGYRPNIARHSCDYPPCCNPKHVLDGTQADNVRDRDERHRRIVPKGTANWKSKLNYEVAGAIRAEYARGGITQQELAAKYGVVQHTISIVVRRRRWYREEGKAE